MNYWKTVTDWDRETQMRVDLAVANFREGYNCSQSVAVAFAPVYGLTEALMSRVSSSFGAGIGRTRETCGSVCAMALLAGLEVVDAHDSASDDVDPSAFNPYPDVEVKKMDYEVVQRLMKRYTELAGSTICRELLGLNKRRADGTLPEIAITATPEARTEEYYRKRPCVRMVELATRVYMEYIRSKYAPVAD